MIHNSKDISDKQEYKATMNIISEILAIIRRADRELFDEVYEEEYGEDYDKTTKT